MKNTNTAVELKRAYVYMPATHWELLDQLRAGTSLTMSQLFTRLIYQASQAAKDTNVTRPSN